ncbi:SBBP repeat-containing protein [Mechercharimyces sp. CAU 1602]|uniref:SBBP repeat-containing protein n=1 Tax=Mechercharimyces sp. CAU 1602 TaxID=2973933 RepID=UPI002867C135|nr:SBBP repeat-containing protein [Mechercharimyces sp. CAU 1602]
MSWQQPLYDAHRLSEETKALRNPLATQQRPTDRPSIRPTFYPQEIRYHLDNLPPLSLHFQGARTDLRPQLLPSETMPSYERVVYSTVWPGIDLIFYGNQTHSKYDLLVQPGANIGQIQFTYEGGDDLTLTEQGDLHLYTPHGIWYEQKPISFQWIDGQKYNIPTSFQLLSAHSFGFTVGEYDPSLPLLIDPVVFYVTYLGGSDLDEGRGITVDSSGNAFVTGVTESTNFPVTSGAFQTMRQGILAFVSKFNAAGSSLLYSTYLGGFNIDEGFAIAIDASNNAYITGNTMSTNFPVTSGAFQTLSPSSLTVNAFVSKLNPTGSSLLYSTLIGGAADTFSGGKGIAVDASNQAYISGDTNTGSYPTTTGAFQTLFGGGTADAFVTQLNAAGSALIYSTLLGGSDTDQGNGIALDASNQAYICGETESTNFPTTSGAFQLTLRGSSDAFITKFNATGSSLLYSTYLGGATVESGAGIDLDEAGNAYVTGQTSSFTSFPVTNNAFQTIGSSIDAFVTKLNATGTAPIYSTYLGGSSIDQGFGIAVDSFGKAWVTGVTLSVDFPLTSDAFQDSNAGAFDVFITQMSYSGQGICFSSYLGGSAPDQGQDAAVDSQNIAYFTGDTMSNNFPTTSQAFQTSSGASSTDAFVAKIGPLTAVGATGPTGPSGATGPTGATGDSGARGPRGRRGPRGPRGPRGVQGGGGELSL